jgi:hypothetical protein
VDGVRDADGRCDVDIDHSDGSVSVASLPGRRYFAQILPDRGRLANGYWSGRLPGSTHAHDSLGAIRRQGDCWRNTFAKVCGWAYP